jgi:hypothetical protein
MAAPPPAFYRTDAAIYTVKLAVGARYSDLSASTGSTATIWRAGR